MDTPIGRLTSKKTSAKSPTCEATAMPRPVPAANTVAFARGVDDTGGTHGKSMGESQLVGGPGPPLWKIWKSIGMMRFPIFLGKCQKWQPVTTNQTGACKCPVMFHSTIGEIISLPDMAGFCDVMARKSRKRDINPKPLQSWHDHHWKNVVFMTYVASALILRHFFRAQWSGHLLGPSILSWRFILQRIKVLVRWSPFIHLSAILQLWSLGNL